MMMMIIIIIIDSINKTESKVEEDKSIKLISWIMKYYQVTSLFRRVRKVIAKASVTLSCVHVCLDICLHETTLLPLDKFCETLFWGSLLTSFEYMKVWLKSCKCNGHLNEDIINMYNRDRLCCLWGTSWCRRNCWLSRNKRGTHCSARCTSCSQMSSCR